MSTTSLVIDDVIDPHTIVVGGVTYEAHHDPESCCGMGTGSTEVCAFYDMEASCHKIPCLARQLRRIGNNENRDVIWLERA